MIDSFRDRRSCLRAKLWSLHRRETEKIPAELERPYHPLPVNILFMRTLEIGRVSRSSFRQRVMFFFVKHQYKRRDGQHGDSSGSLDQARNQQSVFSSRRIVVVAEQQHLIDRRSDLSLGGFDQPEPQIPRRELNTVKVA